MHLALELDGDFATLPGQVAEAEAAGVALVTIADSPLPPAGWSTRVEAGVRAAYLSRLTSRIGLAPTLHATVTEPFQLASLPVRAGHRVRGDRESALGPGSGPRALAFLPQQLPGTIDDIVDKLVPALQERGVYRTGYTGSTLREHLDLPR